MSAQDRVATRLGTIWGYGGIVLGLVLLLVLGLYRETVLYLGGLWVQWQDGGYDHGFLVVLISAYLIYRKRAVLARLQAVPSFPALVMVAACSGIWLIAAIIDIQIIQVVILLFLILAVIWALAGKAVVRALFFPVMYIGFALPVWEPLLPLLREITAGAAFTLTRMAGITAWLQDYQVTLPAGKLSIEEACSGLNYLLAALALGTYYAYLYYREMKARILVVIAVAVAAILANILRVFIIIYIAALTDMQHPIIQDHLMLGWYLFGGLVAILLLVDFVWHRQSTYTDDARHAVAEENKHLRKDYHCLQTAAVLLAVIVLVAPAPLVARFTDSQIIPAPVAPVFPAGPAGWSGPTRVNDSWMPVFHGATDMLRSYRKDNSNSTVLLYVGLYQQQRQGSELVNALNRINNAPEWRLTGTKDRIARLDGLSMVEREMVSANGQQRLVWYIYRVAGRYTNDDYLAKFLQATGFFSGQPRAAVIILAADYVNSADYARRDMENFMQDISAPLALLVDDRGDIQRSSNAR